jgi:hypothetical protein
MMRIVLFSLSALLVVIAMTTVSVVDAFLVPNRPTVRNDYGNKNGRSRQKTSGSTTTTATTTTTTTTTQQYAFWRNWIPETDDAQCHQPQPQQQEEVQGSRVGPTHPTDRLDESSLLFSSSSHKVLRQHYFQPLLQQQPPSLSKATANAIDENNINIIIIERGARRAFVQSLIVTCATILIATSASFFSFPSPSSAVSGGGLDFAGLDISGQDFSNKNVNAYKGKDFTQVIAKGTNFAGSNLQGCRFYKAYLVRR